MINSISYAIEFEGITSIDLRGTKAKIINAFITVGDNLKKPIAVSMKDISGTVRISDSEKSGKVRMLSVNDDIVDTIEIETDSDRKIIITFTMEY